MTCDRVSGYYLSWNCTVNLDCSSLFCMGSSGIPVLQGRQCISGLCKWSSSNVSAGNLSLDMRVSPLSGVVYDNGSGKFYLMYCETGTNGFRVVTSKVSHTRWILGTGLEPYVGPSGEWSDFGVDGLDKSARIDILCEWSGGLLRNANVGVTSIIPGSRYEENLIVPVIVFKSPFRVNLTGLGDVINLSANRNALFFVKGNLFDRYVPLNAVPAASVQAYYLNITNTTAVWWMANTSYGESATGLYSRDGLYLISFTLSDVVWPILFAWWLPTWSYWMIVPLTLIVAIVLPLAFLFFMYLYLRSKDKSRGGG